jgi:hypothetical protein
MSDKSQSHRYDSGVTEPSATRIEQSKLQPGQWTLRHLVIVLAVVAVGSAIVAPWLRLLPSRLLVIAGAAVMIAIVSASSTFAVGILVLKRIVVKAGRRLLQVELNDRRAFKWYRWMYCLTAACGVGLVALFILSMPSEVNDVWMLAVSQIAFHSFNAGMLVAHHFLQSLNTNYLFSLHDNGLVIHRTPFPWWVTQFIPWDKITRIQWSDEPSGTLVVYTNRIRHILPMDAAGRETVRDLIAAHWSGTQESTAAAPAALSVSR